MVAWTPVGRERPMDEMTKLDAYLPEDLRFEIEEKYYAKINEQARLEHLAGDPGFLEAPTRHIAFFADHGVVHVRDVAKHLPQVLESAHGTLIPRREPERLRFMKGYGVALAYLHDIGMVDFTRFGRAIHAEYATQAVLGPDFDGFSAAVWDINAGNMAWRLKVLSDAGALTQDPRIVLREMLAMANCHSKSAMPVASLIDRQRLRAAMQTVAFANLAYQYAAKLGQGDHTRSPALTDEHLSPLLKTAYRDLARDSFAWLESNHGKTRQLIDDVVDTLRALRCADALRQRGTVLRTSGGYEVFVDVQSGNAVYAMRLGSDKLYFVEADDAMSAGEANIASSELERDGSLRIAFHVGAFGNEVALDRAVASAAAVVNDVYDDVASSFLRKEPGIVQIPGLLVEAPDDNPRFAESVLLEIARSHPAAVARMRTVPGLKYASTRERELYVHATELDWNLELRNRVLQNVAASGQKTATIDPVAGFKEVRLVKLEAGEWLLKAGDAAGFVFIALAAGCIGVSLGGYEPFKVNPWIPMGVTAVVRRGVRNSGIVAERETELLMIPRDVYLVNWHSTYGVDEFVQVLETEYGRQRSDSL